MQGGVGEHGVEFALEGELLGVHDMGVEAARARRRHHVGPAVHRHHVRAGRHQLLGQRAVAAADVEDMLARLGSQKIDQGFAEIGHETGVAGVAVGVPVLFVGHSMALN